MIARADSLTAFMLAALNPVRPKSASAVSVQHNLLGDWMSKLDEL